MNPTESGVCRPVPSFMTPEGTGVTAWIIAVLTMAVLIPAGSPEPIAEGLIPRWLLLSPARVGWFYFLLCPVAAMAPALATAAIHWAANRLAPGGFQQFTGGIFLIAAIGLGGAWALAICRDDPELSTFGYDSRHYVYNYHMDRAEVFLGVALATEKPPQIRMIGRPSMAQGEGDIIDEGKLREAVLAGVDAACRGAGKQLYPHAVVYIKNSPPRYQEYEKCAKLLASRVLAGRLFRAIARVDKY